MSVQILRACRALVATMFLVTSALALVFAGQERVFYAINMLVLVAIECCLVADLTGRIRKQRIALRRSPDYSRIASMEREVWGEAFEHAGVPAVHHGQPRPDPEHCWMCGDRHRMQELGRSAAETRKASRIHCLRCGSPEVRAAGRCPRCYRQWKLQRLGDYK